MTGTLIKEIKQTRPFSSLEEELMLNLFRTADALKGDHEDVFKERDLSGEQYNVLRILRGAGKSGLHCNEISARMLTRSPDMTRLLDRLEKRKLVKRSRSTVDRRVVTAEITEAGLTLLAEMDRPVHDKTLAQLKHMPKRALRDAIRLLEMMRAKA